MRSLAPCVTPCPRAAVIKRPVARNERLARAVPLGASTSAFQVEGGTSAEGRGESIWDAWAREPGRMRDNETGEPAAGHYARWAEDVGWLSALGARAYRFSIAWPRVLPAGGGAVNEAGFGFYERLTDALLAARIEPIICLYHWDLPQAVQQQGGWPARDTAGRFADYAAICAARLADRVRLWATFNEPNLFTMLGHLSGAHPPGLADRNAYLAALHHVNLAHGEATRAIRAARADALVGCIHNIQPVRAVAPEDSHAALILDALWNRALADPQLRGHYPAELAEAVAPHQRAGDMARIRAPADWFGLNHYSPLYAKADPAAPFGTGFGEAPADGTPATPIGWRIEPAALRDTILDVHRRYRLPIIIAENGYGAEEDGIDLQDSCRIAYHRDYIAAMQSAMAAGADVRGYLAWSLLDNLEWASGRRIRFGLIRVEPNTLERQPKASFAWYRAHIAGAA
ncbi:GH1 family beta-glucosidase [Sediminicoccus sp. BL-A-41-H5]|uniref:GH1 family beta-glucosidase n=1 Tax=Sediminicoccus sp. BL-A-41-H5 TaxID=3421106 RepID=UPI003D66A1AF